MLTTFEDKPMVRCGSRKFKATVAYVKEPASFRDGYTLTLANNNVSQVSVQLTLRDLALLRAEINRALDRA